MRVPIFPEDLIAGSGFTRIAKRLKRDWPGAKPIRLSEAQEILAHCLGYSNYHDVTQSAELHRADVDFPPLQTLIIDCLHTILAALNDNGHCNIFTLGDLQESIYNWPFLQLSIYRKHYGHSDNHIVCQAIKANHMNAFLRTQVSDLEDQSQPFKIGFSRKQLQAIMGHLDHLYSEAYVPNPLPMGLCQNDFTGENTWDLTNPKSPPCIDKISIGRANPTEFSSDFLTSRKTDSGQ